MIKLKKTKKSKKQRGTTTYGWGARKKHKGSGHRGGFGMAGTGKRADHKKSLMIKKYGNKYFGKQGITSKSTEKKKTKIINLRELVQRFKGPEIKLKDYKVLGDGDVNKALIITAKAFTQSARDKIEKAGGKVILSVKPKSIKPISPQESSSEEQKESKKSNIDGQDTKENKKEEIK